MRNNYVLVDLENVQPDSLDELAHDHFKLLVFVGANQSKLPFDLVASLQRLGSRAEYIKISGNGANALDFHIAFYIGQVAAVDPTAYFHIISKDAGFDPLIQHLKAKKIFAGRVKAVSEIPIVKTFSSTITNAERLEVVIARLQQMKAAKPRTVATLSSTISAAFHKQVSEQDVASLLAALEERGHVCVTGKKVSYTLPDA